MPQSVRDSWVESIITTLISVFGTFIAQWIVFPLVGIHANNGQLWFLSLIFGLLNTIKTFFVRRHFNKVEARKSDIEQ